MLKRLNAPLQKERHELRPGQRTSSCTLQNLNAGQQGLDIFYLCFHGRRIPRQKFLQIFVGIKGSNAVMVRGRIFLVFDIKLFLPPTLHQGSHVKLQIMRLSADRHNSPA
jgi:hypothetical protein